MIKTWKPDLEETKQRYVEWWNHKGVIVNMWEHFQQGVTPHADIPMPEEPRDLNQKWFDPQWRARYLDWYVAHSSLKADILPVANTQLGPGSLAAILGGVFEGGEDTIWIHPDPDYTDDITFDDSHPNWLLHKDLLRACKERARGNYYVGMPDLMEGMDVLAAMKGTDKVLLDTVMQPDVLERQMQTINDIYFKVFDELYDIIREGDEMAFCYFSSWAPGKMSKLQSDISTMISVEDYRRFVQPFIREQTRRIDYTLYHLDGVGAVHHLPALLEIEELNAIQWTPGVGEPQGGSSKWYDLYKKILDGGKSVMACWVTTDELRPLLKAIGTEGIHLEMDFHNEEEVEEALRIVDECRRVPLPPADGTPLPAAHDDVCCRPADDATPQTKTDAPQTVGRPSFMQVLDGDGDLPSRVLVLDGGMGTMIQQYALREEDFRGARFARHDGNLKGCNDLLVLTCPFVIRDIHRKYLEAGADIIETDTFNAQRISMADYHMESLCREINIEACRIARQAADEYTRLDPAKPRFVAGSVGPTSKTTSMSTGTGEPLDTEELRAAYKEQMDALVDGGVDVILIETIFDTLNAKIALEAAADSMKEHGKDLPVMLSFSLATSDGHNMLGQPIADFVASLPSEHIVSVGINCVGNVRMAVRVLTEMASRFPYHISLYPNAGMPDGNGHYSHTPEIFQRDVWPLLDAHLLNIIGGCCGTTDRHIRKVAEMVQPVKGLYLSPLPADREELAAGTDGVQEKKTSDVSSQEDDKGEVDEGGGVFSAILRGKSDEAEAATRKAVSQGTSPQDIINGQMIRAMSEIGRQFQDGKAFVPQLLMAGRAMKSALALLKPLMAGNASATLGRVVIGTVKGDLHDIGKNLVASMLEGCGFEVHNVGVDVSCETFVNAVKEKDADILCMSALLTTTMTYMKDVIKALEDAGIRDRVKVMIGGAPVTQGFADDIGADGYSDNANTAVALAKKLMAELNK